MVLTYISEDNLTCIPNNVQNTKESQIQVQKLWHRGIYLMYLQRKEQRQGKNGQNETSKNER